jgi:hypothetical protein
VTTDRRDARTLADALRLEAYRPAHRSADRHRHVRAELAVRDTVVRTRTRYVALVKALVRRDGFRLASGAAEHTLAKLAALPLPPPLAAELAPLVALLPGLDQEIAGRDELCPATGVAERRGVAEHQSARSGMTHRAR